MSVPVIIVFTVPIDFFIIGVSADIKSFFRKMSGNVYRYAFSCRIGMAHVIKIFPKVLVKNAVDTDVFVGNFTESSFLRVIVTAKLA